MITDNQVTGNWGEQYVSERFSSAGCLIRHVPQGHDSGIDLYCESISEDGKPFLHFWCQVKTSEAISPETDQNAWDVQVGHLKYWLRQPIPVILALVPNKRDPHPPIFVCTPTDLILQGAANTANVRLRSTIKLHLIPEYKNFLNVVLVQETFVWEASQGKVSFLKTPDPRYTVKIPVGKTAPFEPTLRDTLRFTLSRLSEDILLKHFSDLITLQTRPDALVSREQAIREAKPYSDALENIALQKGLGNFEVFVNIGLFARLQGDFQKAEANYQRALQSIDNDPNIVANVDPWKTTRQKVMNHLDSLRQETNVRRA